MKTVEQKSKAAAWQREWLKKPENKAKRARYYRRWNQTSTAKLSRRKRVLQYRYQLSWEAFVALLEQQSYKCAICSATIEQFGCSVDHDHVTGRVRGLLCHCCNSALGLFKESRSSLVAAIAYLDK